MAYKRLSSGGKVDYSHDEYFIDSEADLKNVPNRSMGDIAINIQTGDIYICDSSGKWVKQ